MVINTGLCGYKHTSNCGVRRHDYGAIHTHLQRDTFKLTLSGVKHRGDVQQSWKCNCSEVE